MCLIKTLRRSSHAVIEKHTHREKWVMATYFSYSSRRQRVAELSSVRWGAGPRLQTQLHGSGSAAKATSCKRLVVFWRKLQMNRRLYAPSRAWRSFLFFRVHYTRAHQSPAEILVDKRYNASLGFLFSFQLLVQVYPNKSKPKITS